MKKWQKILIGVIVVCVALIAANGLTMKGFCYTLSYPGGEMIFMEKGHCYVGLPGSKKSEELSGVSYTGRPQKLSDTKDVSDTYKTVLWTFVSVDQGRWVGVHFLNRSFLVQTSGFTKAEKKSLDHYKYVAGKPYFVFKNNGSSWDYPEEYQEKAKENLKVYIEAAKQRGDTLDHVLFYGPPGLGKTTLAGIIANEMGVNIKITSGPAIEKPGEMAAILNNLQEGDVLFVDEIHRLNRQVEEVLYPAMEDYAIDIVIGKGASARSIRLDLPKFTLVGATTRAGLLTAPLRDRF